MCGGRGVGRCLGHARRWASDCGPMRKTKTAAALAVERTEGRECRGLKATAGKTGSLRGPGRVQGRNGRVQVAGLRRCSCCVRQQSVKREGPRRERGQAW